MIRCTGLFALLIGIALPFQANAQSATVYSSITAGALAGYGEANTNNPIFGDQLVLSQGGTLNSVSFTVFNTGASAGPILTGNITLSVFDNTIPYAGGAITNPLLISQVIGLNFGAGLPAGSFSQATVGLLAFNITVPTNILVTQQFTLTGGTATQNGVVLFNNSAIGSSPNTVFISSSTTPSGSYSFGGGAANSQFGYAVTISVPEPGTIALLCVVSAAGCVGVWRHRRKTDRALSSKLRV